MTGEELRAALKEFGFNQSLLARKIGVDPRTVRAWVRGESRIPGGVVLIFEMLGQRPELANLIKETKDQDVRKHG